MAFELENERVPSAGQYIDRYTLVEEIYVDDFVREYIAKDETLDRLVTLKIFRHSQEYSKEFADQFINEARALAQLNHPNILRIFGYGQDKGYLFLVTEHLPGEMLEKKLGNPMEWRKAIELMLPIMEALDYAHEKNIIHRDLNPGNILVTPDDVPIVSNFRLSQLIEEEETRDLTSTNVGLGSPFYMSPEQGKGDMVDYRADIYASGVILYELVTGRKLFDAQNGMEVVIKQVTTKPMPPRKYIPGLPEAVETVILTALDKDPDKRFQSMADFITGLTDARDNKKTVKVKPGKWLWGSAAAALVILLVGAFVIHQTRPGGLVGFFSKASSQVQVNNEMPLSEATLPPTLTSTDIPVQKPPTQPSNTAIPRPTTPVTVARSLSLPNYPVVNAHLSLTGSVIATTNIQRLVELSRLGNPFITSIAWSETYHKILGGTSSGVYYFDSETISPESVFEPKGWITAIGTSPDEKYIATGDLLGVIRIWELKTGKETATLTGHKGQIIALRFSPDSKYLVSSAEDLTARYWDIQAAKELQTLTRHGLKITAVRFSPDGSQIFTASQDFKVMIWDAAAGTVIKTLTGTARINDMDLSPDGRLVVTGLQNTSTEIWDVESGKKISTFRDPKQVLPVLSVVFSQNNKLVATGSADGIIRHWSAGSGVLLNAYSSGSSENAKGKTTGPIVDLIYAENGTRLIGLTDKGNIEVFVLNSQQLLVAKELEWAPIGKVEIDPSKDIILFQVGKNKVYRYSIKTGKIEAQYDASIPEGDIFFHSNGNFFLRVEENLGLFDSLPEKNLPIKLFAGIPENGSLRLIQKDSVLSVGSSKNLQLWSLSSGFIINAYLNRYNDNCHAIFPDYEQFLAAGSAIGVFTDENSYQAACKISLNPRRTDDSYSQDDSLYAVALNNGMVEIWNIGEKAEKRELQVSSTKVNAVDLSPNGKIMATGDAIGVINIWDTSNLNLLATLDHHHDAVNGLAFSEDGKLLISSSSDGTIQIWGIP